MGLKLKKQTPPVVSIHEHQLGTRTFRIGDVVRFGTGKKHGPRTSAGASMMLLGSFVIQGIEEITRRGITRLYYEVRGLDKTAGSFRVFAEGKSYKRFGVRWRPYRVIPALGGSGKRKPGKQRKTKKRKRAAA